MVSGTVLGNAVGVNAAHGINDVPRRNLKRHAIHGVVWGAGCLADFQQVCFAWILNSQLDKVGWQMQLL